MQQDDCQIFLEIRNPLDSTCFASRGLVPSGYCTVLVLDCWSPSFLLLKASGARTSMRTLQSRWHRPTKHTTTTYKQTTTATGSNHTGTHIQQQRIEIIETKRYVEYSMCALVAVRYSLCFMDIYLCSAPQRVECGGSCLILNLRDRFWSLPVLVATV